MIEGGTNAFAVKPALASAFHSVMLRTAGFNSVPMGALAAPTIIFSVAWMFVGGSPGSTAGGVKTTTLAVLVAVVTSMVRGRTQVELFQRTIPRGLVYRSLSIVVIGSVAVAVSTALLCATQPLPFEKLFFEVVSAFGTVGLSMDVTPMLDAAGRWLVMFMMYLGRLGPLTLALAIGERLQDQRFRLPDGHIATA